MAEGSDSVLYLCPSCGALVRGADRTCRVCKAPLTDEVSSIPAPHATGPTEPAVVGIDDEPRGIVAATPIPPPPPPTVKVPWRPSGSATTAPPGRAPRVQPGRTRRSQLGPWRELTAIGSGVAVPAATFAASVGVAGHEWGLLFLFGVLFGIGAGLTLPDLPGTGNARVAAFGGGLAVLLAVPLAAFSGRLPDPVVGLTALAFGTLGVLGASWQLRASVGPYLPWLAGLLLLAVLAAAPLAFLTPGPEGVASALWAIGGVFAVGAPALVAVRRGAVFAAEVRLRRGDRALASRDAAAAVSLYDRALRFGRLAGRSLDAGWYGKGCALVALGRNEEAIECLDRALALNPENEIAWVNKGTALTRLGRLTDALRCYNSAIRVNPGYEVAWNNKGNALARLGRNGAALASYDRALELDPAYRTAWVNRGYVLTRLGRYPEAAASAETASRLLSSSRPS